MQNDFHNYTTIFTPSRVAMCQHHSSLSLTAKPSFTVPTDGGHKDVFQLQPYNRFVILNASDSGIVVVDCSATSYPDPTYTWQVTVNGTDIGDSCISVKDGGKVWNCDNILL